MRRRLWILAAPGLSMFSNCGKMPQPHLDGTAVRVTKPAAVCNWNSSSARRILTLIGSGLNKFWEYTMSTSYNEPTTKLTYDDYVLFPNDGKRHEIIQGRHHMNPAPSPQHQTVSRRIQFQLYEQVELKGLGQVFNAPIDLQLSETDVVQPDIVVVLTQNNIITTTKLKGVPNLVIEILSPSNREYDRDLKRRLYEQHAVPEYWIVDPENQAVQQLRLGPDAKYSETTCSAKVQFQKLDVQVDLRPVWST
jgi:Uma2 family endonuclease